MMTGARSTPGRPLYGLLSATVSVWVMIRVLVGLSLRAIPATTLRWLSGMFRWCNLNH
jgi:hypothetical protein